MQDSFTRGSEKTYQQHRSIVDYLLIAAILIGLVNSFQVVYHNLAVDFDTASIPVFWQNIERYGWKFLLTIRYFSDGFQFSWMPIYFSLFWLLGPHPLIVIITGWLAYVGCIAGTSFLTYLAAQNLRAALAVAAILSFANPLSLIAETGFLAFPIAHTISILYGVFAALSVVTYIISRRNLWLILMDIFLIADCASDPWAITAILLPIILASIVLCWHGKSFLAIPLHLAAVLAFVAVYQITHGFGLFTDYFEPPVTHPSIASLHANWWNITDGIAQYFNANIQWAKSTPGSHIFYLAPIVTMLLFMACTIAAAILLLRNIRALSPVEVFCTAFFLLSTAMGLAIYFVFFRYNPGASWSARYYSNSFFFAPAYAVLAFRRWRGYAGYICRFGLIGLSILFAVSTVQASMPAWRLHGINVARGLEVQNFLLENDLRYGYGGYFGPWSNAVTWVSGGRVLIRPVSFSRITHRMKIPTGGNISSLWYEPGDQPDKSKTFVILTNDSRDGCSDINLCAGWLAQQFGPPLRQLNFTADDAEFAVLVWDHPLLGKIDPSGRQPAW